MRTICEPITRAIPSFMVLTGENFQRVVNRYQISESGYSNSAIGLTISSDKYLAGSVLTSLVYGGSA